MQDRPWTKLWIQKFKQDPLHGHKRFKRLQTGYPPFEIDDDLIDIVDLESFIKVEEDRIPLFIGTQFGIYPRIDKVPNFINGRKLVAILGKSLLSGHVAAVSLHQIEENDITFKFRKVATFLN